MGACNVAYCVPVLCRKKKQCTNEQLLHARMGRSAKRRRSASCAVCMKSRRIVGRITGRQAYALCRKQHGICGYDCVCASVD